MMDQDGSKLSVMFEPSFARVSRLQLICGVLVFATVFSSCASTPRSEFRLGTEPDSPLTNADPASYAADAFTFSKVQRRREPNNYMFYYKHCAQGGDDRGYYSRTSYWCSEP